MRILVYEFASGGGVVRRDVPPSVSREGAAMRRALVADLRAIGGHEITAVVDLPSDDRARGAALDRFIRRSDAVWLIAPETTRCLERLAAFVERRRRPLLGSSADAVRIASDKAALPQRCAHLGLRHPRTRALAWNVDPVHAAAEIGFPLVVKPVRGAGSDGVTLVRDPHELRRAVSIAARSGGGSRVILQQYVRGEAASVSVLADGSRAVALALNAQILSSRLSYRGGVTPLKHRRAPQAIAAALALCRSCPGLRGFVGVDVVLTDSDAFVIEVNPRLTTAYLGIRSAVDANVAALALSACTGHLPRAPRVQRRVGFTSTGRLVSSRAVEEGRGAA